MEKENVTPTPEDENVQNIPEEEIAFSVPEDLIPDENIAAVPTSTNTDGAEQAEEYTYTSRKDRKKNIEKPTQKKFKARYVVIPLASVAVLAGGFFALPFTQAEGIIANNVWVDEFNLSGLTEQEAEELLATEYEPDETDFSVVFTTETDSVSTEFTAEEIEYAIDIKGTAADAVNFGKGGNWAETSWNVFRSFFTKVNIGAKPTFNTETLSKLLYELGAEVHGEGEDVQILVENNTLSITPATLGQSHNLELAMQEFSDSVRNGITENIPVTLKSNESDKLDADKLYDELACEPKNAEYTIRGNEVIITDHIVGLEINKAKLSALVDQINNGIAGTIDVVQKMPEITTESIQKSLFGTTLASYSSNYASSSANRAYNVELAASKINGIIIPNGAEFSYNNVVGNANAANGFKMATVFANGKKTEGVGGGVCQVSSTLYCAVLRSDLEVTERRNHSLPIGYVPGGQDATVSYGSIDFKFKNNTGAPIKLEAVCSNRNLTVSILGSENAKKNVEISSQKISTIPPEMTEIPDPSLPAGTRNVVSHGSSGSVYLTYKRVKDANGKIISETSTKSTYKSSPGEVKVGTAAVAPAPNVPAAEAPATPVAPTPEPSTPSTQPTTPTPSVPAGTSSYQPETPIPPTPAPQPAAPADKPATPSENPAPAPKPDPSPAPAPTETNDTQLMEDGYPAGL